MDHLIISILAILVINILIDFSFQKFGHFEFHRKLSHISGGIIVAYMVSILDWKIVGITGLILSIITFFVRKFDLSALLTESHKQKRGYGELYFAIGMLLTLGISVFNKNIAIIAILITTLADGLAPFGRLLWNKILYHKKTFGGSLVFFLITISILYFGHTTLSFPEILLISFCITVVELFSPDGSDNLLIPAATALLIFGKNFI